MSAAEKSNFFSIWPWIIAFYSYSSSTCPSLVDVDANKKAQDATKQTSHVTTMVMEEELTYIKKWDTDNYKNEQSADCIKKYRLSLP